MDNKTPLVSVIIPTFNSAPYLERCLDSVCNQSLKNIEIVAVDDCSTDDSVKILERYASEYDSMKVVETASKGLAGGARNLGMTHARGKYIGFVDSDDWIDTNYYLLMLEAIEANHADIVLCGVKREYENRRDSCVRYSYNAANIIKGTFALSLLCRVIDQDISISAIVCNKLFRSNFLSEHDLQFFENCLNEDDIFTFHAFLEAKLVGIVSTTNYHLYQRRNSVSRSFSRKHIDDLFFAFSTIRKILERKNVFDKYKNYYFAFFEKCLSYLIESLRGSEQDDEVIDNYFKYAFSVSKSAMQLNEFIDYCGSRRIEYFFE